MKIIVRAAVIGFMLFLFGGGVVWWLNLPPTPPRVPVGERLIQVSAGKPAMLKGAAWFACGTGDTGRLIIDKRSPGKLGAQMRRERGLHTQAIIHVGARFYATKLAALPLGWFDHYDAPMSVRDFYDSFHDAPKDLGLELQGESFRLPMTITAPAAAAALEPCLAKTTPAPPV